ncbi:MAG: hypothetical protein ACOX3T_05410 [Bdellovibrionota bacterium]
MILFNNSNLATKLDESVNFSNLATETSECATDKAEFDKLLKAYLDGIKVYTVKQS